MFKKIIPVLILISIFIIGIAGTVSATAPEVDRANFKVDGMKIGYDIYYGKNKNELYLSFYRGEAYGKDYVLKKSKNNIKSYEVKANNKLKHLKTYKTTQSLNSFYSKNYKTYIQKQVKADFRKEVKKYPQLADKRFDKYL